jgi:parvulin-like peptidyl-prolyl isomerase
MENLECPQCGKVLEKRVAVCGACGGEVKDDEREKGAGRKKLYAILAVLLALLGGAALLIFTGLLPNPLPGGATIAIVNGERISAAEVNQKLETYKKINGRGMDFSSPEGKKTLDNIQKEIVQILIRERVLVTEAAKEGITVSPQEIANRIDAIQKGLNLSAQQFKEYLRNNGMSLADFTRQIERQYLISRLIQKGTQKGLKREAWVDALRARATVEVLP